MTSWIVFGFVIKFFHNSFTSGAKREREVERDGELNISTTSKRSKANATHARARLLSVSQAALSWAWNPSRTFSECYFSRAERRVRTCSASSLPSVYFFFVTLRLREKKKVFLTSTHLFDIQSKLFLFVCAISLNSWKIRRVSIAGVLVTIKVKIYGSKLIRVWNKVRFSYERCVAADDERVEKEMFQSFSDSFNWFEYISKENTYEYML